MARKNGSSSNVTQTEQTSADSQPEHAPPPDSQGEGNPENPAQAGEQGPPVEAHDEPGPEDFARHTGARLISDHEQDLRLQEEIEDRIGKRAHEIAVRTRKKGVNAIVTIGGKTYQPRAKSGTNSQTMILAEVKERVSASLD